MRCVECGSEAVTERPERTAQGYKRYRCRECGKQLNERSGTVLNRAQYPSDVIVLVVLWRLRYKLSLRDLPEMFALRGMVFSHEAVRDWEAKLTPTLAEELRRRRRDKAFFRSAKAVTGVTPDRVTTDSHDSYPRAIRTELGKGVQHRTNRYLNNRLEQDHRGLKGRYWPMLGFKCPRAAARFCRAYDELRNYLRPRARRNQYVPAFRRRVLFLQRTVMMLGILEAA